MAPTIGRRRIHDFGFYVVVLLVATAAWQTTSYMTSLAERQLQQQSPDGIAGPPLTTLDDVHQRQLDAYLGANSLLTTFGTTLLGALGFLLFGRRRAGAWTRHRWAAFVGALCVAVSIFFGYVAYLSVLSLLRDITGPFDLTSSYAHWAQQAHFYTFLAGVVFLGDFIYHNLLEEGGRENLRDVTGT